jgi:2,3-dihydroxybenzoate decarboxylase
MKGKIVFEEHMAIQETLGDTIAFAGDSGKWKEFKRQILDMGHERIDLMDKIGIEFSILSNNAPGIQGILDTKEAIEVSRKANNAMAEAVARHPKRYGAFAALPMQDPEAASEELTRCVNDFGFYGAMVNGFTQKDSENSAIYYDIPEYRSFWSTVSDLNVPFYLHPRMQLETRAPIYNGHPWLKSSPWGFAVETSIHALRMCGSGMFDDYPDLKIFIGHLGEHIPYDLWRIDARMDFSRRSYRGKRPLGEYFLDNFMLTTSGNFSDPAFRCCLEVVGIDSMFFSADYPFETMRDACEWFDTTKVITEEERLQIGRTNAINYFNLDFLDD